MNKTLGRKLSKFVMILSLTTSSLFISSNQMNRSMAATNQVGQINPSTALPVLSTGTVISTKINVRTTPVNTSKIFVTLSKGAKVSIVQKYGPWYKIKTSKGYGWVMAKYVNETASQTLPVIDTGTITATKLNVRLEPVNTSTVFVSLSKGGKVSIVEKKDLWYKIKTSKGYGWVMANYIKVASIPTTPPPTDGGTTPPTTPTIPMKDTYGKVTAASLNVRKGPGTSYDTIKALTSGTIVSVTGENNGWYQITSGTTNGWVSKTYIQLVEKEVAELGDFKLVIDPGHGGSDPGTSFKTSSGVTLKESLIVLKVSQYLKGYLAKLPINSYYTRETDVYPTLTQRVDFTESKKADAFISIHINSTPSHTGDGTETYYYGTSQTSAKSAMSSSSESAEGMSTAAALAAPSSMSIVSTSAVSPTKLQDSKLLAGFVQKRLVEKLKLKDRGTKSGNFHVIRESSMASILTELGFIDNSKDNVKLNSSSWQQEAAKGIYLGILDYLKNQGYQVDSYYIN